MSRSKKEPPKGATEKITKLAENGVAQTKIAKSFGISYKTWLRWKDEHDHISEALQEARTVEEEALVGMLYEKAMDGDKTAAMFLLKTRHGYLEGDKTVNANQVNVSISVPGSMNKDDYKKAIEVDDE